MAFKQASAVKCSVADLKDMGRGASPLQAGRTLKFEKNFKVADHLYKVHWTNDDPTARTKEGDFPVLRMTFEGASAPEDIALASFRSKSVLDATGKTVSVEGMFPASYSYAQIAEGIEAKAKTAGFTLTVKEASVSYGVGQQNGRTACLGL